MTNKYYVTTPIYYANGSAHLGHLLTTTVADVLARYYRLMLGKKNVFFTTGLDEHGTTVEQSAAKEGYKIADFQKYVDKRAVEWKKSFTKTNISFDYFARTTDSKHKLFAQEFIKKIQDNDDIYKSTYKGKYCNGCEKFLTLSDLDEHGLCPIHRKDQVVETKEENYFFKLSKYVPEVKKLIESGKISVHPESKKKEMLARIDSGVEDVSISRPKEKVAWGVEFPDDKDQTVYVWIEALLNYTSSLAINNKSGFWKDAVHVLGKDINWFHNVIWPSLLLAAGHPLYKGSFVHGFLLVDGGKISKSLGNIITPEELTNKFRVDGTRYLVLSNLPFENDSNITWEHLNKKYNADLANGIGNLVARVAKLCVGLKFKRTSKLEFSKEISGNLDKYRFDFALKYIWKQIKAVDTLINKTEVWKLEGVKKQRVLEGLVSNIRQIGYDLAPFLPVTASEIQKRFSGVTVKVGAPLFPRI